MLIEEPVRQLTSLPVLSVRQPWASYLVSGLKYIELRRWVSDYQGWVWVHTGRKVDMRSMELMELPPEEFPCGGLVGLVKITKYHLIEDDVAWNELRLDHMSPGEFFGKCYGWELADAVSLGKIIECPGKLGLFRLSPSVCEQVQQQLSRREVPELMDFLRELELGNR